MSIDFGDLELPLAQLAADGAEAPRPEVKDRLMARIAVRGARRLHL